MSALMFSVRAPGNSEIHRMEATCTGRGIRFTCTCSDGTEGRHCEHRLGLLLGDTSNLVEVDQVAVEALATMTKGSPLLQAVHMLAQAEAAAAEAEFDLQRAPLIVTEIQQGEARSVGPESGPARASWRNTKAEPHRRFAPSAG